MTAHVHPVSGEVIEGTRLVEGAILQETDLYDSTTGNWEECPCAGLTLQNTQTIWVRTTELPEGPREILDQLRRFGGKTYGTIFYIGGRYWVVPDQESEIDSRVQWYPIFHPESLQELIDRGYLKRVSKKILVLTDEGCQLGNEIQQVIN